MLTVFPWMFDICDNSHKLVIFYAYIWNQCYMHRTLVWAESNIEKAEDSCKLTKQEILEALGILCSIQALEKDDFNCYTLQHVAAIPDLNFNNLTGNSTPQSKSPVILDMTVCKKNGFLSSAAVKKQKDKKPHKENKFTQFVSYIKQCNYPDGVIESATRYIQWLLGNRKISFEQWKLMIDSFNAELKKINNVDIRAEAALDAFNTAFAGGYQKLIIDRYKYNRYTTEAIQQTVDPQKCNTKTEEVTSGVYKVVQTSQTEFVKDENGNILTF